MTKPIMSIKILEDFTTYTDADDDWITEHVPEAWEAREVLNYITELESTIEELIEVGNALDKEIETTEFSFYVLSEEILQKRVGWERAVADWKERVR